MDATSSTNLSILVVDDDIGAATALGRLLRAYGHIVRVAFSSREGLELALRLTPDLILHDIVMSQTAGYEAARRLRGVPSLSRTVLIACSGSVDEAAARQAGFDGWLVKPISSGELDTVLAMVLQRISQSASHSETEATRGAPE